MDPEPQEPQEPQLIEAPSRTKRSPAQQEAFKKAQLKGAEAVKVKANLVKPSKDYHHLYKEAKSRLRQYELDEAISVAVQRHVPQREPANFMERMQFY